MSSVNIQVIVFVKTTSSHEGNLRVKRIRNSGAQFFVCLVETLGAIRAPCNTFFQKSQIMNQIDLVPEITLN